MKKSKNVPATLVVAVAAFALGGCGRNVTEVRRCVDATGHVLPDSACTGPGATGTYSTTTSGYSSGYYGSSYYSRPHWIYGGSMSGNTVSGYHTTPTEGADIADSAGHTISRGGFGGSSGGGSGGSSGS